MGFRKNIVEKTHLLVVEVVLINTCVVQGDPGNRSKRSCMLDWSAGCREGLLSPCAQELPGSQEPPYAPAVDALAVAGGLTSGNRRACASWDIPSVAR